MIWTLAQQERDQNDVGPWAQPTQVLGFNRK